MSYVYSSIFLGADGASHFCYFTDSTPLIKNLVPGRGAQKYLTNLAIIA